MGATINGNLTLTGTYKSDCINVLGVITTTICGKVTGSVTQVSPPMSPPFPDINAEVAYLQSVATQTYNTDVTYNPGQTYSFNNDIVFVNGNINFGDPLTNLFDVIIKGHVTFVATGNINFFGGVSYSDPSSDVAGYVAKGSINFGETLTGNLTFNQNGFYLGNTVSVQGATNLTESVTTNAKGGLFAQNFSDTRLYANIGPLFSFNFTADPRLTSTFFPPSLSLINPKVIRWQVQ